MWPKSIQPIRDRIQKSAIKYLLQRFLGQFLDKKLTLDQLTIDLFNGTGSVSDVGLDVQAINELSDQHNLPFEFVDGYLSNISVFIPWKTLLTEASYVEVRGLEIIVQPKQTEESDTSVLESMLSSMSSSIQMATECFQQSQPEDQSCNSPTIEGVEKFAQIIDTILRRVKVKFVDTLFRLEHLPKGSKTGVAIEVTIKHMDYCDEAEPEGTKASTGEFNPSSGFTISRLHLEGVSFYLDEFPAVARTFSKSLITSSQSLEPELDTSAKNETKPILIAKLSSQQEVRLQMKREHSQGPKVQGPKVDLELTLGSLIVFLSPRQLHLLLELSHGLSAPDTQDNSNVARCVQKPMGPKEFEKVEQQLLSELQPITTRGLHNTQGWSSAPPDDSDEEFFSMQGTRNNLSGSTFSDGSSLNASFSSSYSSYSKSSASLASFNPSNTGQYSKKKRKLQQTKVDGETSSEENRLHVRLSSLAVVLLHEDILIVSPETGQLTDSSIQEMCRIANQFFIRLGPFAISGYGKKDFEAAKSIFLEACQLNHIRLLAAPVIIESDEKRSPSHTEIGAVLTAASVELLECLVEKMPSSPQLEVEYVELLKFEERSPSNVGAIHLVLNQPDVRVKIKHSTRIRSSMKSYSRPPITNISMELQNCSLEIDLSMIDRISTVLNPLPLCIGNTIQSSHLDLTGICQPMDLISQTGRKTDLTISSSSITIMLRFPIPDLRPVYDMDRQPWWKRNVRKDIMFSYLVDATFSTCFLSSSPCSNYEIKSKEVALSFQEGDTDIPVPIAVIQGGVNSNSNEGDLIRLVVKVFPRSELAGFEENTNPELPADAFMMQSIYIQPSNNEPSPFSSKHVLYKSEDSSQSRGEELITPGNREEMGNFIDAATRNTKLEVEVNLPKINIHFPSKHIYELIFNRFNTDLSLWTPSPQVSSGNSTFSPSSSHHLPTFSMCKSAIHCDSDSDSEDREDVYQSMQDSKSSSYQSSGQSKVTFNLNIGQGTLSLITNIKNTNSISQGHGHLQLRVKELSLFTVSAFKGTPQLNYVCAQVNNFTLDHCCELTDQDYSFDLRKFSTYRDTHLNQVIYRTEAGGKVHRDRPVVGVGSGCSEDMLTLVVRSQMDESHIKLVKVSCGIRGATLRHCMTYSRHSWLMQLLDFFNAMDYPVAGYQPSQVVTELHQHLWDCALDYRPLHLPLRCVLAVDNLSISTNVAAKTGCSTFRFIAEDAFLFISNKTYETVELRLDYVCVMDLGLFELTLRMKKDSPQVDLRAFNNTLNIRTCSDSAKLLAQFLGYVASCGDFEPEADVSTPVPTQENVNPLSESVVLRVNKLMEEAMIDNPLQRKRTKSGSVQIAPEVELFYFPGETEHIMHQEFEESDFSDSDIGDFVMVEHEPDSNLMEEDYPIVQKLTDEPQIIIENHFAKPLQRIHDLEPPQHFPTPVYAYELCEMTLQWHMYGGSDFQAVGPVHKKHVSINTESESVPSSPAYKRHYVEVNYSKTCPQEVGFLRRLSLDDEQTHLGCQAQSEKTWWQMGGIRRDHNVLIELNLKKLQFRYHVYPKDTEQASRQALAIKDVEICDRLKVSSINKFLYQYSNEQYPKLHRSNMVVVRALHIRPNLKLPVQECSLRVQVKPLRFNIDQDTLLFLINFVSEITDFSDKTADVDGLVPVSPRHMPPVMGVDEEMHRNLATPSSSPSPELLIVLNEPDNNTVEKATPISSVDQTHSSPMFFRRLSINAVLIKLDYVGKRVDMTHGPLAGLLMGLTQLNNTELWLQPIQNNHGLLGFEKLAAYIQKQWFEEIRNQLPTSLLTGIGPMNSVAQLFWGIRDLFWMPIEQYHRDGRVIRGLQRGAHSFSTSTCLACLELTTHLVQFVQSIAETTFDMVSPGPSVRRRNYKRGKINRSRNTPPADFREGVTNAVALVTEGIGETAHTLVQEALAEHEDKGAFGAVGGVLRQIPPTVVTPIILASAATSNLLGGVRSQLVPDTRREAELKWREQSHL